MDPDIETDLTFSIDLRKIMGLVNSNVTLVND